LPDDYVVANHFCDSYATNRSPGTGSKIEAEREMKKKGKKREGRAFNNRCVSTKCYFVHLETIDDFQFYLAAEFFFLFNETANF